MLGAFERPSGYNVGTQCPKVSARNYGFLRNLVKKTSRHVTWKSDDPTRNESISLVDRSFVQFIS